MIQSSRPLHQVPHPVSPPPLVPLLKELLKDGRLVDLQLAHRVGPAPGGRYRHWDKLRHLDPPADLSHREWWALIKQARHALRRDLSLRDRIGRTAFYILPDPALQMLTRIDQEAGGRITLPSEALSTEQRDRYIISSLIEEAITSSQLEGAVTTRRVAKEMLRTGRPPTTKDEQMILNNFRAMRWIRERLDEPLSPQLIFDLHRVVTEETLAGGSGTLRRPGEDFGVYRRGQKVHQPPAVDELEDRMLRMCAFANEEPEGDFMHPVIKAVILHYWLAYDHPFEDGNGRTARALFYWFMLKEDYWLFEYVSISTILKNAPARYGRAYLYTQTDENDLTYFILHQLDVILRALDELRRYLRRKVTEARAMKEHLKPSADLNHRQVALLSHAHRHPGYEYTYESHRISHGVVYQTARTDLLGLEEKGFLSKTKRGRTFVFRAPADLADRLRQAT